MRPDGHAARVMATVFPEWDPAWSPNGRVLTFRGYYGPGDGQYDLYAAGITGCHRTRLTSQINGTSSSWSPDGSKIVFSDPDGMYVVNASGGRPRELLANARSQAYEADTPSWSVDNRIAYTRTPPHGRPEIYTITPNGTRDTPLTQGPPGYAQPAWSPDGTSIAFTANPYAASSSIVVASSSGAGAHQVSPAGWTSYSPTWTPDGKIVFLRQTGHSTPNTDAPTSAYIVNPDGTGLRLLYPRLNASQITWGPGTLPAAICQPR